MTALRPGLPPLPERMRSLPVDDRGYPVPWFVTWVDGKPEFRVADGRQWAHAVNFKCCWLCGQKLGAIGVFAIGPMCSINRVSSEPPSHRDCAEFAVRACPFLSRPEMRRRERGLPEDTGTAGVMCKRNPGVTLLWATRGWRPVGDGRGRALLVLGRPLWTTWWAEGRAATRAEVQASIDSGYPQLEELARQDGAGALRMLEARRSAAMALLPGAA